MKNELFDCMEKIKNLFLSHDYENVIKLCEKVIDNPYFDSPYILGLYAKSFIKINRPLDFIEVYKNLTLSQKNDLNVINNLCWCYYHGVIKTYDYKIVAEFDKFLKTAEYIVKWTKPNYENEYETPYIVTVFKVLKVYKLKPSKNYNEILSWLDKVDKSKLSENCFEYKDEKGKDRELASRRERYYQYKSEAYEKLEDYENCIKCCDEAFVSSVKWHYRNGKWLNARKLYSECIINNGNIDYLKRYEDFAFKENEWFMFSKLSDLYFRYNNPENALIYAFKAVLSTNDYDKLVKVFMNIGILLRNKGKEKDSILFFRACAYYRYINGWKFNEELDYIVLDCNIDYKVEPNKIELIDYSKTYLMNNAPFVLEYFGYIDSIDYKKNIGYINCRREKIFFSLRCLLSKKEKISKNDKVRFLIGVDKNNRKYAKNVRLRKWK